MQNDRLYKKVYNDHKAKISIPGDMVSINAAKEGQALASNVDYRQYLHQWSCFPDQNDVIQARKAYDLQSDVSVTPGESLPQLGTEIPSNAWETYIPTHRHIPLAFCQIHQLPAYGQICSESFYFHHYKCYQNFL
jgi:hypothetical protein